MAAEPGWTLLISMMGVLAGLSLGIFVGASNKKSEGLKNGLLISVIMLCCFFAGMMGDPILRDKFETMMPLFAKVNPIAAIADGYYALFAYNGDMEYYWQAFARIAIFAGVMLVLSLVLSRRKRYDSI
jgi:ABC-2 type transport system permease protein